MTPGMTKWRKKKLNMSVYTEAGVEGSIKVDCFCTQVLFRDERTGESTIIPLAVHRAFHEEDGKLTLESKYWRASDPATGRSFDPTAYNTKTQAVEQALNMLHRYGLALFRKAREACKVLNEGV